MVGKEGRKEGEVFPPAPPSSPLRSPFKGVPAHRLAVWQEGDRKYIVRQTYET